ncbi:MAG TPA: hypothetical protein VEA80_14225 [Vitreimonas sp.]|nr:hypothetical protein [Vitreimonas sp.]
MNYSIRYTDAGGVTIRSEFLPFDSDDDASTYAGLELPRTPLIEVWKGDDLVTRMHPRGD